MKPIPKGYITDININPSKIGPERRQQILDGIVDKNTFLPNGVLEEDMDQAFIDNMNSDKGFKLLIDGEAVPVIFLTLQRWSEFSKTWQTADKYKNIQLPFITVVRKIDIQQGENQAGLWNIPGDRTYTFYEVPTWDGVREGVDLYKIPQPTSIDMLYEVRLFTNRMQELNKFSRLIQRKFQSNQCYLSVKGHPMPLSLQTVGDESNIDDFESKKFYVQLFEMKLKGYIMDEEDFEVVPTINRTLIATEISENATGTKTEFKVSENDSDVIYKFKFNRKSEKVTSFKPRFNSTITDISEIDNISRVILYVNDVSVFDGVVFSTPITISKTDTLKIKIYKGTFSVGSLKIITTKI